MGDKEKELIVVPYHTQSKSVRLTDIQQHLVMSLCRDAIRSESDPMMQVHYRKLIEAIDE